MAQYQTWNSGEIHRLSCSSVSTRSYQTETVMPMIKHDQQNSSPNRCGSNFVGLKVNPFFELRSRNQGLKQPPACYHHGSDRQMAAPKQYESTQQSLTGELNNVFSDETRNEGTADFLHQKNALDLDYFATLKPHPFEAVRVQTSGKKHQRVLTDRLIGITRHYKQADCNITQVLFRQKLIADGWYTQSSVPSSTTIGRAFRKLQQESGVGACVQKTTIPERRNGCRRRITFSAKQRRILEKFFDCNQYPSSVEYDQLFTETSASREAIKVWFSNKRAKWRKEERQFPKKFVDLYCRQVAASTYSPNRQGLGDPNIHPSNYPCGVHYPITGPSLLPSGGHPASTETSLFEAVTEARTASHGQVYPECTPLMPSCPWHWKQRSSAL